ncbi:tRNA threonylcarbamoyladenosine dehydratase [Tenacibaculum maritimum]|uniref:ThiF binding family protein n=1 Tax=Tenacibaculum maritimum NCIMB 2154 TaxID=1349785 RepID=A0A2H1EC67_9FLAO|nr:tRNA threonylcarbamoyladenosine dehydratase [Tenacibaculum maritimum]MCD9562492.1 tRNA threonylcarbamoyladenosine dehydratase [Tenacibaculum maritimum]MCD9564871.1 tRNA threonylcarbamoyladenosine dehydratase [Tenacibaculum maritimum]MCD9577650.1 tRNA threonylcarbamoyladenosine dehydratase [Tenacibaculum maritimum]MCD9583672.1 tRNA threonylcarbamoyladenosine dehydratase [Tenacibaculum maritimum]MCD9595688.1 tRNA threonylcarbamoyladenosine dehydratase [Tenacibaculum maritimum]
MSWLERTELLVQKEGLNKIKEANILIVGLGGVGSFAAEFIARAGVERLTIVDGDVFDETNKNRQLPALNSTVGKSKVKVIQERLLDINPEIKLTVLEEFLSPERAFEIVSKEYDYVLDCIDSITPKINLIVAARRKKVKLISSMGAGGKLDATKIRVKDISKTKNCTMARVLRRRLKELNINKGIKAVYSEEVQIANSVKITDGTNFKKSYYGTISYMPAAFGLQAAAFVINQLIKKK